VSSRTEDQPSRCRCGWSADRNRGGAFLASLLTGAGLFAMFVFLSYYLQSVLHYSALKAGLAFLPFAFASFWPRAPRRVSSRASGRGSR